METNADDLKDVLNPTECRSEGELSETEMMYGAGRLEDGTGNKLEGVDMTSERLTETPIDAPQALQPKNPVFIGCNDMLLLGEIKTIVESKNWADTHVLALMAQDVYMASVNNWHMSQLGSVEKARQKVIAEDTGKHQEALKLANELNDCFKDANGFKYWQLKDYFETTRKLNKNNKKQMYATGREIQFSNKDLRNVIDFLCTHKLLIPTLPDTDYKDQVYALTLQPSDRLKFLDDLTAGYNKLMDFYAERIGIVQDEALAISNKITEEAERDFADVELSNEVNVGDGNNNSKPEQV